jgi:hypothetical protein
MFSALYGAHNHLISSHSPGFFVVLGMEASASLILGKSSTTKIQQPPPSWIVSFVFWLS